jgi:hypothetical protein
LSTKLWWGLPYKYPCEEAGGEGIGRLSRRFLPIGLVVGEQCLLPTNPGSNPCLAESISPLYFGWVSHTSILICWSGVPPPLLLFSIGRLKGHPLKLGHYATQSLPRHFFTQLDMMIFTLAIPKEFKPYV